jgi:hypothetical protein
MSLNLKNAKKGLADRQLAPIGNHIARCYQVIDLGTQDSTNPAWNASHKLRFSWELCEEMQDFGKGKKEPYSVSMTVNFFFGRNSNFTKVLEGWHGGPFTDKEQEEFDLRKLVGKACMLNVVHQTSGDRDYANVASVSPVPTKWLNRVPPMVNQGVFFEVEMGPQSREFLLLPDFLQKLISQCHEWKGKGFAASSKEDPFADTDDDEVNKEAQAAAKRTEEDDSDIPF